MDHTEDGRLRELVWALAVLARDRPSLTCREWAAEPYPARFEVCGEEGDRRVALRIWPNERRARIFLGPPDGEGPASPVAGMTCDLTRGYWLGRPAGEPSASPFGGEMFESATRAAEELLDFMQARLETSRASTEEAERESA